MRKKNDLSFTTKELIVKLRKSKDNKEYWEEFKELVGTHIVQLCNELDTRWLVSICDTFVDYGDEISRRNAMLVVQIANFEKLWATYLLMYDVELNQDKLKRLRKNKVIPLWDGMYSFNINHGDMTNNLFRRLDELMVDTPVIKEIYKTVLERIKQNNTLLANLNQYHKRLFEPYQRRSLFRILKKRIRKFFKTYKL